MQEVIPHWVSKRALLTPNDVAIELKTGDEITFLQLEEKSKKFARKLASLNIQKGDHIGIFSNNHPGMIIAIHAISYIGAVAVLLNTRLMPSELQYQIEDANVSVILTEDALYQQVEEMNFSVPVYAYMHINQMNEQNIPLQDEIYLQQPFTIIYTSGTTGHPKGVVHTYGNHWWSAIGSALNLGLHIDDKWLAVLPLFHVGGLSICIRSIMYGIPIYLLNKFSIEDVHEAIMMRGVTIASVVTVMLRRLTDFLGNKSYPNTFRCMLLGGGPAPRSLLEKAKEKNIPVFQSYGLTETSSQIATLHPKDAFQKLGSAGKALFPGQIKINDPNDEGVGEIYVKGPMVTEGYYEKNDENKRIFTNGWLATGDLGYLDAEQFLYVMERRTDLIISGGENIYPSEIEGVLAGMKEIKEVGVVGKRDPEWGEVPVAFVVLADENISEDDIIHYAKKYLANYKIPKEFYFPKSLPRTASNKLIRYELKQWLMKKNN